MSALPNGFAAAERIHDRREPVNDTWEDWTPSLPKQVTEDQVEQFIFDIAENGSYPNDLGIHKTAPSLYFAIASQWRHDKAQIPTGISAAFFQWAKSAALIAEHGKQSIPGLLREQAGLRITKSQ